MTLVDFHSFSTSCISSSTTPLPISSPTHFRRLTLPPRDSPVLETLADFTPSKTELIAENALLRQQLVILHRQIMHPRLNRRDRFWLLVLASQVANWKQALRIIQPDRLLRWHREGFRLFWKPKSHSMAAKPRVLPKTIGLIKQMAMENRLWGTERIRGGLLKLGLRVAKRTTQKYMRGARPPRASNQTWGTFLKNHAQDIWACDLLPVMDLCFRQVLVFFIIELGSRRVVHFGVTRHPSEAWVTQEWR